MLMTFIKQSTPAITFGNLYVDPADNAVPETNVGFENCNLGELQAACAVAVCVVKMVKVAIMHTLINSVEIVFIFLWFGVEK